MFLRSQARASKRVDYKLLNNGSMSHVEQNPEMTEQHVEATATATNQGEGAPGDAPPSTNTSTGASNAPPSEADVDAEMAERERVLLLELKRAEQAKRLKELERKLNQTKADTEAINTAPVVTTAAAPVVPPQSAAAATTAPAAHPQVAAAPPPTPQAAVATPQLQAAPATMPATFYGVPLNNGEQRWNLGEFYQGSVPGTVSPRVYGQGPVATNSAPLLNGMDPRAFLHSSFSSGAQSKHKRIVDFVPDAARMGTVDEDDGIQVGPGLKLVQTGKKRGLETVTISQWMAANASILAELVQDPSVPDKVNFMLDYQGYTAKIGVLAATHTWKSVIQWDDEYRQKQHQYNFRWGSESAHLNLIRLVPREQQQQKKKEPEQKKAGKGPSKGQPSICFNWNKGTACRYTPCPFQHVCEHCESPSHPKMHHDRPPSP